VTQSVAERVPAVDTAPEPAPNQRIHVAGWIPFGLLLAGTSIILHFYGVALPSVALFVGYVAVGITLPGTLVWRALYRGDTILAADLAAGTALGYVGEVLAYIPARAIGLPLLVLAWPAGVLVAFIAIPRLRRHWRRRASNRPPVLWSWSLAAAFAAVLFYSCKFFRLYGLSWPYYSAPDTDSTFHLALIGEAKHHMPMATPWVSGEPLYYHWFVYAEMAATSWVTGIEPQVLLLRLSLLPMLAAFVVLVAVLAVKLFGHWWTGIAAVGLTLFVLAPYPYGWSLTDFYTGLGFSPVDDGSALRLTAWTGPTQTFGALLFVPVVLLLVDLAATRWALLAVLLVGVMGAKATYLPLLLAGLVAVLGRHLIRRRLNRPVLVAIGITAVLLVVAQIVLFGGRDQGLHPEPLRDVKTSGLIPTGILVDAGWERLSLLTALAIACWIAIWAGISGLVRHRTSISDGVVLMLGLGAAGIGATLLLGQDGDSQRFFFESGRPYLSLAAVGGLATVLRSRSLWPLIVAAAAGLAAVLGIKHLTGTSMPTDYVPPMRHLILLLIGPYVALAAVAVGAAVLLALARRRFTALRGISHALLIAFLAGYGLSGTAHNFAQVGAHGTWRHAVPANPIVSEGTLEAGRWLRNHSDPNDLVATNVHCLPSDDTACTNLHFAVAAYTERRMLVEGWGFTATAHQRAAALDMWSGWVPFWRPDVLADNDQAFSSPSPETVGRLRDRYGVRWLFVDSGQSLEGAATLRFRSGNCAVYEILRPGEGL
jgi:hypothetical protein